MAKRKSNRRQRAAGIQRRGGGPPPGVGRRLDDLLKPGVAPPAPAQPVTVVIPPAPAVVAAAATAPVPEPAPHVAERPHLTAVPDDVDGPVVRLAVVWAVVTFVAAGLGVIALAVWFAALAAVAALQTCRSWKSRPRGPDGPTAAAGAALIPLAAAIGAPVAVVVAAVVAIVGLLWRPDPRRSAPVLTVAVALGLGMAAAAPVLVRRLGLVEVIVLLSLVGVYDGSAFLVGTGAAREWEGPVAGVAFMFAVTLAAAAVFGPPFGGGSAWLLGALAAALAPLGPIAAQYLVGAPGARVPTLRRLDSLLVLGPLWTLAAYALL